MATMRASIPELSYSEVFEIERGEGGLLKIVLTGDEVKVWLTDHTGMERTFVDVNMASEHCEHDDSYSRWSQGWDEGFSAAKEDTTTVLQAIVLWHDDNHPGPARFCHLEPCSLVRQAAEEALES